MGTSNIDENDNIKDNDVIQMIIRMSCNRDVVVFEITTEHGPQCRY